MSYKLAQLDAKSIKELIHRLANALMEAEDFELLDIYNSFVYQAHKDGDDSYREILPNEVEYLDEFFEGEPAASALSIIHGDEHPYSFDDAYFTIVDECLTSIKGAELKSFLNDYNLLPLMAKYLVNKETDLGIELVGEVMKLYDGK